MQILTGEQIGAAISSRVKRCDSMFLMSPFITDAGVAPIINHMKRRKKSLSVKVLTSIDYMAMLSGALDIQVLREFLRLGEVSQQLDVQVRSCDCLHAKLYLFDDKVAIAGSANATAAGFRGRNVELGFVVTGSKEVSLLANFADDWWSKSVVLDREKLDRDEMIYQKFEKYRSLLGDIRSADQVKPLPHQRTDDYFETLRTVILAPLKNGRAEKVDALARKLQKSTDAEKCSPREAMERIDFIRFLGLLRLDGNLVTITDHGRAILGPHKRVKQELLHLILGFDARLNRIFALFSANPSTWLTYKKLNEEFFGQDPSVDDWALGEPVQWLRSLDAVDERRRGNRLEFRLKK